MKLYMVAKLLTKIEYTNPITKEKQTVELKGCAGYAPIFKTKKEAKEHSQKGKYQIVLLNARDSDK